MNTIGRLCEIDPYGPYRPFGPGGSSRGWSAAIRGRFWLHNPQCNATALKQLLSRLIKLGGGLST
jgi:hypothetical protein